MNDKSFKAGEERRGGTGVERLETDRDTDHENDREREGDKGTLSRELDDEKICKLTMQSWISSHD